MDEDGQHNRFWVWMESRSWGRKTIDAWDWLYRRYYDHVDRYHAWEARRYRFFTWLVTSALILVMLTTLAGTVWVGRHYYRHYRQMRSQQQAQAFLARGDFRNASLSARQALEINPNDLPASRVMAELADRSHSPLALDWLRRIALIEPTVDNKLVLASVGLKYQKPPFSLTAKILNELAPVATNNARYHVVAASLAMQTLHLEEAEAHFELASKLEPTNKLFQMSLASLRLSSTDQTVQAQSRATLEKMRSDETIGPVVLRALVADRLSHKDAASADVYSSQLVASPHATLEDQFQNLEILRQLKSNEFKDHLQTLEQKVATNALAVAEMSAWMQGNGLLTENLDWLTGLPVGLLDQRAVQMSMAQGYLQGRRWTSLLKITDQGNWGDLEYLRFALNFRAWSELGAAREADSNWNAAVGQAAGHRESMERLLQLAENWHLQQREEAVLLQMVQKYPDDLQVRQRLESLYYDGGNTIGLHQLYSKLHTHFPDNTNYANNLAATSLLLKADVRNASQLAAEVYAKNPGDPYVASTYAFALHTQGWDKQGLAIMEKLKPSELEQPSVALYYGLLLAATGKADQAAPWLQIAQTKGHLLPEEKELLTAALGANKPPIP